jgi:hypothetical protein
MIFAKLVHVRVANKHFCFSMYSDSSIITLGPKQYCEGLSPGGGGTCFQIPENCGIVNPISNTMPTIVCQNGTSFTG